MEDVAAPNQNQNPLKRRREDKLVSSPRHNHNHIHIHEDSHSHPHPHPHYHQLPLPDPRKHLTPRSRTSKRMRLEVVAPDYDVFANHASQFSTAAGAGSESSKAMDLRPCHICRRKPTVRRELDAFAECEGCGRRACWVCIRECMGGEGFMARDGVEREEGDWVERGIEHRGVVCSRCCVERGEEGEVICLGCLRMEGGG
ncbi:cytochrome c1 heme precursor protein [Rutstroemia sp. NJR-2017a BVV2]|nr:cytochrome c1 heme precursor protein [Rutstroemia sp. NJR-2017a BVV2]PQE18507.1 cytochrome c1 heme precursor protein [Rutstroemia sp. NJR-2017a BVV2]